MFLEEKIRKSEQEVNELKQQVQVLLIDVDRLKKTQNQVSDTQRQVYNVKDLARILGVTDDHARKAYIHTGRVKANKTPHGYVIIHEEFMRVKDTIMTRSKHYL